MGGLILALYLGFMSFSYPADSAFFPRALSVLLGLLSVLLFIRLCLRARKHGTPASGAESDARIMFSSEILTLKSAGLTFGSIIAYGLLVMVVNYEVSSVVFLAGMMFVLGFRKPLPIGGLSVGLTILLYGIFFRLLGVSRPESIFFY